MAPNTDVWTVIGGGSKGGLIVREGKDFSSPEVSGRLATGAVVKALECDVNVQRILYEKVSGEGPSSGWVSTAAKGKDLLVKVTEADVPEDPAMVAMQLYCERFGKVEEDSTRPTWNRKAFTWKAERQECQWQQGEEVRADLERDLSIVKPTVCANEGLAAKCGLLVCSRCKLPVGELAYKSQDGEQTLMHGECLAQFMLQELTKKEQALAQKEADAKRERREEFDIGWKVEHIPRNVETSSRMNYCSASQGMCCIVLLESDLAAVAPTMEPAAAVNLEYLSIALQVRYKESREPVFSLDPIDPANLNNSMQQKRFEPAWLAGTSVGEVLFQADYHLKELSMGEYEQPVLGMKSIHDYSDGDEQEKWRAREWFVVRKAEVQMTEDNVLLPRVKMGVEAREQVLGEHGLDDVRTTRPDHPLVKYADSFTHNFDLIAERKSVVYHLRELAKASVLAKFLAEANVALDDSWFSAAREPEDACCLEIPQLWNERCHSQIRLQDGQIMESADSSRLHRLYGGVQFGLDKFQLAGSRQPARLLSAGLAARQFVQPSRHLGATLSAGLATRQFQRSFGPVGVQPARVSAGVGLDRFALAGTRQPSRMLSAGLAARQFVQPARHLSATLSAGLATRQFQRSFGPVGVQPSRVAGVDLSLDEFNLSAPTPVEASVQLAAGADISNTFWKQLGNKANSMFGKEDQILLQRVFHPSLSDRREEGDRFVPPDTSLSYVQGLRALVGEEDGVRSLRRGEFLAAAFDAQSPGSLFPSSWRSSLQVAREGSHGRQGRTLQPRPDYKSQAGALEQALKEASPTFDKSSEDGTRFRIYRIGSLEVRTLQDASGAEEVGMVFSLVGAGGPPVQAVRAEEKVVKATEYVEASANGPHCYLVLETEQKHTILAEMVDGVWKHEENAKDLEDRNSLAKVLRSADVNRAGVVAGRVRHLQGSDVFGFLTGRRR